MRKANLKRVDGIINKRLADARISERDREVAAHAMRRAETIVDAIVWAKEKISSLGALLLSPGFKH